MGAPPDERRLLVLDATEQASRALFTGGSDGYAAPVWIDAQTLGAIRQHEGGLDAVAVPLADGAPRRLCRLDSADMDWSPDRRSIVCAETDTPIRAGGRTTLRVLSTGL